MFDFISLIPTIISGIQGISGQLSANRQNNAAYSALAQNAQNLANLTPPNLQELLAPYQQAVWLGQLTPEQFVAQVQQDSQLKGIQVDPSLVQAQAEALAQLKNVADQKGLTATDRARLQDIASQEATRARGARQAGQQALAQRGMSNSGLNALQAMLADQGAAQNASARGTQVAALAQERALQAMQQAGQLAGNMRSQSFNEQAQIAAAQDAINRFNTQLAQDAANRNTAAANDAAAQALRDRYAVQSANLSQANRTQDAAYNAGLQQYQLDMQRANALNGANTSFANFAAGQARDNQNLANNALSNVGRDLGSMVTKPQTGTLPPTSGMDIDNLNDRWTYSDPKLKTGVNELTTDEVNDVLNRVTGIKYRYKDPELGQGQRVGVSADELDSSPVGSTLVAVGEKGKVIDNAKATQFALAALSDMNKRLTRGGL